MTRVAMTLVAMAMAACSKEEAKPAPAPSAASASAAAPAPAAPAASATTSAWSGTYTASPGSFYVPDGGEWSGVKFRGDDASDGLGGGTLKVTVEPGGRAHGTLDGALGALRVDGELRDAVFSATLTPPDPSTGFSGMLIGKSDGGKIAGTMRASLPTGSVIRQATFSLEKSAKN